MTHKSSVQLLERLRRENAPASHLDECAECVARLLELKELELSMAGLRFLGAPCGNDCPSAEDLADFVEYRHENRAALKAHLQQCDHCFEAVAYYHAESIRMKGAEEPATPAPALAAALAIVPRANWVRQWLIAPLPAYAAAALFWIVFLFTEPSPEVVLTRDSPFFTMYEKEYNALPYFYFVGDGRRVGSEVSGMRISTARGKMHFRWNAVAEAEDYYFVLQEIRDGAPHRINEKFLKTTSYTVDSRELVAGASYRWVVAGRLPESRYFQGTMEFHILR